MNIIKRHPTFFKVILITLILYFSLVGFWTGFYTKLKIQSYVKSKTGLSLDIGLTYLYPFTGNGYVKNIRIPNPPGFFSKNLLKIDKITFKGGSSVYSDVINLASMEVKGIEIHFEPKEGGNNFQRLAQDGLKFYQSDGDREQGFKRMYMQQMFIDPIRIVLGPEILNKNFTLESVVMGEVGTKEKGIGIYGFGNLLLERYVPVIRKTLEDPATPIGEEARSMILKGLDTKR